MIKKIATVLALSVLYSALAVAAPVAQENIHYKKLPAPQPVVSENHKTVVVEFFSYGCPHCAKFDPIFKKWSTARPNIEVQKIPVGFHRQWVPLQKLYYTLEALHVEDRLGPKVFEAIHIYKNPLYTDEAVSKWAQAQGLDKEKFNATYSSFTTLAKVNQANQKVKNYLVDGVPYIAIDGKYVVMNENINSMDQLLSVVDDVLLKMSVKK